MDREYDESKMVDGRDSSDLEPIQPLAEQVKRSHRHASVYDAVAGRVTLDAKLDAAVRDEKMPQPGTQPPRLTRHPVHASALAPEEVLFRRKAAPERFAEFDLYMAHERNLPAPAHASLPDSDLLKAVHSYASHFYAVLGGPKRNSSYQVGTRSIDERSMDESALLAFGILLEEAGRDILGAKGDMVFTEGEEVTAPDDATQESRSALHLSANTDAEQNPRQPLSVSFVDLGSWKRARKRRKMTDHEED
ncbi:hypothetical protein CCHL11_06378 [Colletotrichum chlorophyti]|uniref:Uncharacterized protein n=1 Tax=Colletotrichum chlorophyti TaxID=708187 RepID=A0A1Q8RPX2_9PEZI|nr:hypothetical protein CCHL11_06378 [Colletotrichum chlorophyti]